MWAGTEKHKQMWFPPHTFDLERFFSPHTFGHNQKTGTGGSSLRSMKRSLHRRRFVSFQKSLPAQAQFYPYRNPRGLAHRSSARAGTPEPMVHTVCKFNNKTGFEGFSMIQNGKKQQQTESARRAHGCTAPVKLHLFLKLSVPLLVGVSPVTHAFFPPSLPCTALTPFFGLFGVHKIGNHRNGQAACFQCIVMCILSSAAGCCLTDSGVFCFVCVSAWAVGDG